MKMLIAALVFAVAACSVRSGYLHHRGPRSAVQS